MIDDAMIDDANRGLDCREGKCPHAAEVERLRVALHYIASVDPVDLALDPDWACRMARRALDQAPNDA